MVRLGDFRVRLLLIIVFLCALVAAQTHSLAHGHPHSHSGTQHCCVLCHAGSLAPIPHTAAICVAPGPAVARVAVCLASGTPLDGARPGASSRAPPSPAILAV